MFRFIVFLSFGTLAGVAQAAPLTFETALKLAAAAPDIEVQTAGIEAAQSALTGAGRLPDPQLLLGIDNLPATGTDQWSLSRDSMTMRKIGVAQAVPNADRRQAEADIARAALSRAQLEHHAHLLTIRRS